MSAYLDLTYRDGCNYKTNEVVRFEGDATPELIERFNKTRDGFASEAIVCEQVGLENPALSNDVFSGRFPDEEDDHGWVEAEVLDEVSVRSVSFPIEDGRTFETFVQECETIASGDGWDPQVCIEAAGGWHDPDDAARRRSA